MKKIDKKNSLTMYVVVVASFHHFPPENKVASCLQDKQISLSQMEGRFDMAHAYLLKRNQTRIAAQSGVRSFSLSDRAGG